MFAFTAQVRLRWYVFASARVKVTVLAVLLFSVYLILILTELKALRAYFENKVS